MRATNTLKPFDLAQNLTLLIAIVPVAQVAKGIKMGYLYVCREKRPIKRSSSINFN